MELIVAYIGFVALSFVGAHEVAGFLGEPSAYVVAGAAFAGHIAGAIGGMGYEKKWGTVTGVLSLAVSLLMIVAGASLLIGQVWPLAAAAGALASGGICWLAFRISEKRVADGRPPIHAKAMVALAIIPCLAIIALSIAVGIATGWY